MEKQEAPSKSVFSCFHKTIIGHFSRLFAPLKGRWIFRRRRKRRKGGNALMWVKSLNQKDSLRVLCFRATTQGRPYGFAFTHINNLYTKKAAKPPSLSARNYEHLLFCKDFSRNPVFRHDFLHRRPVFLCNFPKMLAFFRIAKYHRRRIFRDFVFRIH